MEQKKLHLLDVGFAGVSSALVTSKVAIGIINSERTLDRNTAKRPMLCGGARWCSPCGPLECEGVRSVVETVLRQMDATVTAWMETWREYSMSFGTPPWMPL